MKILKIIDDILGKIEEVVVMLLLIAMVIVVSIQVINQAFIHLDSITWTEEISRIMLVWSLLVGSCIAVRRGAHLAVDFVYDGLKGKFKVIVRACVLVICIYTCFYVARSGYYMVLTQNKRHNFFGITHLPLTVASSAVPVCFAEMGIRFVLIALMELIDGISKKKGDKTC